MLDRGVISRRVKLVYLVCFYFPRRYSKIRPIDMDLKELTEKCEKVATDMVYLVSRTAQKANRQSVIGALRAQVFIFVSVIQNATDPYACVTIKSYPAISAWGYREIVEMKAKDTMYMGRFTDVVWCGSIITEA